MIAALLIGRKGSTGLPGKNLMTFNGHALAWYPMKAALDAARVDKVYISTDCEDLMALAKENGIEVIERPAYLCTADALGEDAFMHGMEMIEAANTEPVEIMILLFCNAANVTGAMIDEGIETLQANPDYDSVVTVSKFNMFSPIRARRINDDGMLEPFVQLDKLGVNSINCDRNCQGDVWFTDCGMTVVWSHVLRDMENGQLPQRWMGKKIFPIKQAAGMDVDEQWQIPVLQWWLDEQGLPKPEKGRAD